MHLADASTQIGLKPFKVYMLSACKAETCAKLKNKIKYNDGVSYKCSIEIHITFTKCYYYQLSKPPPLATLDPKLVFAV